MPGEEVLVSGHLAAVLAGPAGKINGQPSLY
jgi:hypothetical protein